MSDFQVIESALQRAARRRRWARALRGMWHGLLVGAILSLLLIGATHLPAWFPQLPLWTPIAAALLPLPFMLLGLIIGGWRKPDINQVARWVDGRQRLQERLSTALEVQGQGRPDRWSELVVNDAAQHIRDFDPRKLMPFSLPKVARWAVVVLAVVAGLGFVPEYRSQKFKQQQAEKQNIKDIGKQLADLTRHSLDKRPPALEPTQKAMEAVGELGDQLTKKAFTRSEALKDLQNMSEKLKDQIKELGKDPALKKLEQAARASNGNDSQNASGLQKQIESLQKQLGTPTGNPEALDKLKKELDKLQEAAKGMADKNSPGTEAEKQKMAESLSALSKQMQEMGLQMPQIDDAINALAANNPDLVLKDLQAATVDLEKMRDMAKSMQQLQQQMDKMGKDLAEQLKNGQPELAAQTLQKMADQAKSSNLSDEQKQKMMKEVAEAIKPAGNYGKVSEHLQSAAKKMESGDKQGASQSMADAAKELQDLMKQMGDAQQMSAELEALKQASACVGSCQGWKMANRPGTGKGGKPGGGVGTWADDENGWMYDGQWSDHWDNSGAVRPDTDGRGQTDRGEGELSDALKPTKVKGQFSPGGQMPSITLKGVSIKGTSKVDYEAAAAAAQSDAQSALSQEKVPRAYQGSVRDYFDDLKK